MNNDKETIISFIGNKKRGKKNPKFISYEHIDFDSDIDGAALIEDLEIEIFPHIKPVLSANLSHATFEALMSKYITAVGYISKSVYRNSYI